MSVTESEWNINDVKESKFFLYILLNKREQCIAVLQAPKMSTVLFVYIKKREKKVFSLEVRNVAMECLKKKRLYKNHNINMQF